MKMTLSYQEVNMVDTNVLSKMEFYPEKAKSFAIHIRNLIYVTAKLEGIEIVEETLKWGEPSFKSTKGTPIRIDWKEKTPDKFYIFFNCQTLMIETCKELYNSNLVFEGNRAIVLNLHEEPPKQILQHCFSLALRYHTIKKLPLLGA